MAEYRINGTHIVEGGSFHNALEAFLFINGLSLVYWCVKHEKNKRIYKTKQPERTYRVVRVIPRAEPGSTPKFNAKHKKALIKFFDSYGISFCENHPKYKSALEDAMKNVEKIH